MEGTPELENKDEPPFAAKAEPVKQDDEPNVGMPPFYPSIQSRSFKFRVTSMETLTHPFPLWCTPISAFNHPDSHFHTPNVLK